MPADESSTPELVRELDRTIDECVKGAWLAYLHQALRARGVLVPELPHVIRFSSDIDVQGADHSADEPFWWAMEETQALFFDADFA